MRFCVKIPSLAGAKQHFLLFFVHREAVTMKALNSYGYITNFQTDIHPAESKRPISRIESGVTI